MCLDAISFLLNLFHAGEHQMIVVGFDVLHHFC